MIADLRSLEVGESVLEREEQYVPGEPVRVRVRKRAHRYELDDLARAVELAGRPTGWFETATAVAVGDFALNVNRRGVVYVPAVEGGVDLEWLADRVAGASLAVHAALLELDG